MAWGWPACAIGSGNVRRLPRRAELADAQRRDRVARNHRREQIAGSIAEVGGTSKLLPYCEFDIAKNSVLYVRMSSGGGYGDPLDREPERVVNDVEDGFVSRDEAREIYGVVSEAMIWSQIVQPPTSCVCAYGRSSCRRRNE